MHLYKVTINDIEEPIGYLIPKSGKKIRITIHDDGDTNYPIYKYKNYSHRSGVYAYAYSPDKKEIYIYFKGPKRAWYKYSKKDISAWIVDTMIRRAKRGWGLNRFINKYLPQYYWKGHY